MCPRNRIKPSHSFGSLAIGRSLKKFPDLKLKRIILFGSILRPAYEWDEVHANGQVAAVLNERSPSDVWPRIAKYCIPDSGPSGVIGFDEGKAFIVEKEHSWTGHSGLSYELHCRQVWAPFLIGD
jgi:serine/threonine-protein kinase